MIGSASQAPSSYPARLPEICCFTGAGEFLGPQVGIGSAWFPHWD
jgi:hypothetical protein